MRDRNYGLGLLMSMALCTHTVAFADTRPVTHSPAAVTTESRRGPLRSVEAREVRRAESPQWGVLSLAPDAQAAGLNDAQAAHHSTTKDLLALTLMGAMLVVYQLFRKHRLLRQQPFSL